MSHHSSEFPSDYVPPKGKAAFNPDDFYRFVDGLPDMREQLPPSLEGDVDKATQIVAEIAQDLEVNGVDVLPICDLYVDDLLDYSQLCIAYEKAKSSESEYNGEYNRFVIMHRIKHLLNAYLDSGVSVDELLLDDTVIHLFQDMTADDDAWLNALRKMFPELGMFSDTVWPVSPERLHTMSRDMTQKGDEFRELRNYAIHCAELYLQRYFGLHDETTDLAYLIGVNAARRANECPVVFDVVHHPVNYLRLSNDQLEDIYRELQQDILDYKD